jgi:hypothetical protein
MAVLLVLVFGAVILIGAPYVPTLSLQRQGALDLLNLEAGQVFVDLGSGDGSMLLLAAQRGLNAIGYEINPFLVLISWVRTRRYRKQVKIRWFNFWWADVSRADGIFVFLIDGHMQRLDRFLKKQANKKTIKLASNAFQIPGKLSSAKQDGIFLYRYRPHLN